MDFFVYILRTSGNTLYTGWTNNLERRIRQHQSKKGGAKYTRNFECCQLVYYEKLENKSEALKREAEIKKWSKIKKEALVRTLPSSDL